MYAALKQLMRNSGYIMSEGDDWAASDTPQFQSFAVRELGLAWSVSHRMLAYPQAFPVAQARLAALLEGTPAPEPMSSFTSTPETEPAFVSSFESTPVAESTAFDLTPEGQMPKQDLEHATAQSSEESTEGSVEQATEEEAAESNEPPAEEAQP